MCPTPNSKSYAKMAENDFVMDNSIAMRVPLPNETRPEIQAYARSIVKKLMAGANALIPNLWHIEAISVLIKAEKQGLITAARIGEFLEQFGAFELQTDNRIDSPATLALAQKHNLSGYDATYLQLAIRTGLPLATADKDLRKAAHTAGVGLYLGGYSIPPR